MRRKARGLVERFPAAKIGLDDFSEFAECGLELRAMSGVDPAPFRTWLLPHLPRFSPAVRRVALAAVTALSLPIDVPFGRALVARSWHAVFVLGHARRHHAH